MCYFPSECDKLRKDGFRSSQYYSQGPTFSSPLLSDGDGQLDQDETEKKKKVNISSIATQSSKCSIDLASDLNFDLSDLHKKRLGIYYY